ncbi:hypothetical protein C2W62_07350 [Candidatus Entotheonella serta]|nr:hypothetical protein C2W62_07350 [Candidatus Entotheonella serta]
MDGQRPVISVIIPVYNEEKTLPATLDQFRRQDGAFEIIAVDGGSADRTCEIVARYPGIHLMRAPSARGLALILARRHPVTNGGLTTTNGSTNLIHVSRRRVSPPVFQLGLALATHLDLR